MAAGGMLLMTPILSMSRTFHCLAKIFGHIANVLINDAETDHSRWNTWPSRE
jgi:hypothetical protein